MENQTPILLIAHDDAVRLRLEHVQAVSELQQLSIKHCCTTAEAIVACQQADYALMFFVASPQLPLTDVESLLGLEDYPPLSVILTDEDDSLLMQLLEYGIHDYITQDQLNAVTLQRSLRMAYYARRQQVEQFRYMFDRSAEGVLVLDNDGQILAVNRTAERLFDRPERAFLGAPMGVPLVTGETHEIDILTGSNELRVAEMRVGRIEWQGHEALLASLHDVTHRKQMESALKETKTLLRSILDALQMHIAVVDENGVIINVNKAWIRFSQENGDIELKNTGIGVNYFDVVRLSSNGTTPKSLRGMMAVLNGELDMFELKYPCHAPDEERWFLMRVTPVLLDDQGERRGLVISHINITLQHDVARKQVEQAIRLEQSRHDAREQEAFNLFNTEDNNTPLHPNRVERGADMYAAFGEQYAELLEKSLDRRAYKVEYDIAGNSRTLAAQMGKQMAKPRDLVKLHVQVLEEKKQHATTAARQVAYSDEGRLLILEVMGYLAAFYRDTLIADLEMRSL